MKKGSAKRKRLTPSQKEDIIASKGKAKAAVLAKRHNITTKTVYNVWSKAKKSGLTKAQPAAGATRKVTGPNQKRIDFCKRWIAILQDEVKRLENETDLLNEAEAVLTKVIRSQK